MGNRNLEVDGGDGKLVLKSIKLAQPLIKPKIEEAVIPADQPEQEEVKKPLAIQITDKLKKIGNGLFKR
ncbi:hypothetical protein DRF60_06085 [Chryseobacterium elymi]|uniref:Uncharacterized protein n=1 Tax=Chryseobacterium elymi TaxID=395936 RepID=A0A3D9DN17_9FLAO|nr:hypothetical protein [Chryseobacterium elymi]REC79392.1 hypothetical protein DRF60_06085 [Chryseobacterium elymi]